MEKTARKIVIENTNALAETLSRSVVKGDLYTPFIDKAEAVVVESLVL